MSATLTLTVNGETHQVFAEPHRTLLDVLRTDLGLTGTKENCLEAECGTLAGSLGRARDGLLCLAHFALRARSREQDRESERAQQVAAYQHRPRLIDPDERRDLPAFHTTDGQRAASGLTVGRRDLQVHTSRRPEETASEMMPDEPRHDGRCDEAGIHEGRR